jgi:hypothetical protein
VTHFKPVAFVLSFNFLKVVRSVDLSEPYPELQSVVATLSTGPVAPADSINHTNASLIAR